MANKEIVKRNISHNCAVGAIGTTRSASKKQALMRKKVLNATLALWELYPHSTLIDITLFAKKRAVDIMLSNKRSSKEKKNFKKSRIYTNPKTAWFSDKHLLSGIRALIRFKREQLKKKK